MGYLLFSLFFFFVLSLPSEHRYIELFLNSTSSGGSDMGQYHFVKKCDSYIIMLMIVYCSAQVDDVN